MCVLSFHRDPPEATGEEPDDADFDIPKIYEPVSENSLAYELQLLVFMKNISSLVSMSLDTVGLA